MAQANVSRAKAIRALKHNKNDIVNAIMVRSSREGRGGRGAECERSRAAGREGRAHGKQNNESQSVSTGVHEG